MKHDVLQSEGAVSNLTEANTEISTGSEGPMGIETVVLDELLKIDLISCPER